MFLHLSSWPSFHTHLQQGFAKLICSKYFTMLVSGKYFATGSPMYLSLINIFTKLNYIAQASYNLQESLKQIFVMNETAKSPFPRESRQGRRYLDEQNKTIEHDPKSYRMAVFALTSAINDFAKRHKSCLGDMEEINRVMLVKEEKEQLDRNLWEVVEKQIDRLSRDSLARNMETKNTYNQYLDGYRKRFMLQGNPVSEVRNTSLPIALRKNFFMEKKQVLKPRQSIQLNESMFPVQPIHTFKSRQRLHLQQRHFKNYSSVRTCEKNPSTKQSMKKSCLQNEAQDRNKQVFISTCRENSEPKNILKTTIIHKIIKYHKEEIQKSKIQERVLMTNNEIEDMKLRKKMKTWAKSEKYCQ